MVRDSLSRLIGLMAVWHVGLYSAPTTWAATRAADQVGKSYGIAEVSLINGHIRRGWEDTRLRPAKSATDGEWCRRVYLDVIGRIPTVEELRRFTKSRDTEKRRRLVDRLLGGEYQQQYARHWTAVWTNTLIGRTGGQTQGSLTSREGMQSYLRDSFVYNKPYDRMVFELISAKGTTAPGSEDFNGATNFLADKLTENAVQATAKTSQIFLGVQVQCTQCHNHPFNEHKQNQFWEMNAFFRQTVALRSYEGRNVADVRVDDQDFAGESGRPSEADIFYELRNGKLECAYPVFIDGTSLADLYPEKNGPDLPQQPAAPRGLSGYVDEINRRTELAKLVIASSYLEQAMVNRMWARLLGRGFTKPFDDMRPDSTPTHPELLAELAGRFRTADFDVKGLIRWIVLSEPYGLSSRMTKEHAQRDNPAIGTPPLFSHFYLRQLEAEQLYESLLVATQADATIESEQREAAKSRWLRQLSRAFGTDEGDESTTFNGSIPQALMLMNGELVKKACGTEAGSFLYQVATDKKFSNKQRIIYLYQAALSRTPSGEEVAAANYLVGARHGDTAAALQDIWWALLNSNEFILNH